MSSLAELQAMMVEAIQGNVDTAQAHITSSHCLSGAQRLEIYHDSVQAILINTLMSTFTVCHQLVGDAFFSALSAEYSKENISCTPDLNDYGATFPWFIRHFEHAKAIPYLADLAQLEWAWHHVSMAEPSTQVDLSLLADVDEANLAGIRFCLPASGQLLSFDYPVHDMWSANSDASGFDCLVERGSATSQQIELNTTEPLGIDLEGGGVQVIVFRDLSGRRIDLLEPSFYNVLSSVESGLTFSAMSERFCTEFEELDFVETFSVCCQQGWISDVFTRG